MSKHPRTRGVELPEGQTGSTWLHAVLREAAGRFPDALGPVPIPSDAKAFKPIYGEVVTAFEAARAASPQRVAIARSLCQRSEAGVRFVSGTTSVPLAERMSMAAAPLVVERVDGSLVPGLVPGVTFRGRRYEGAALGVIVRELRDQHMLTTTVADAIGRLLDRAAADGGRLVLRGERFALMGAGAELAPTELLLRAGATVLWVDLRGPDAERFGAGRMAGSLIAPLDGADLLAAPDAVAATLARFAEEGPIHVGLYAYAGGESQEWRLTAAMNGVVRALPSGAVRSLALLISPTTPQLVSVDDARTSAERRVSGPSWRRALARAGLLHVGQIPSGDAAVARAVVSLQGVSYQAAQYLGKVMAAEAMAVHGPSLGDAEAPLTVSANVAPITATRSLTHPLFEAGFLGAAAWGILIAEPAFTTELHGLLMLHDVLLPEAPGAAGRTWGSAAERGRAVLSQQVHGGVYSQPWVIEESIRVAAVQGLAQKPGLLFKLLKG